MVFRQMFAKGLGASIMESDEELGLSKTFMNGKDRFEISQSDVLNEKEKQLRYDLDAGDYQFSITSVSGKFKLKIRVHNKTEDFVSIETKLFGKGKHSKYDCGFKIERHDAPVVLDIFFKDQQSAFFWKKSSYDFQLVRVSRPEPSKSESQPIQSGSDVSTPRTPYDSFSPNRSLQSPPEALDPNQKIKVKVCVGKDIRFLSMYPNTNYDALNQKLIADYGDDFILKYEDIEGQYVTIENQEDLQNFFQFCNKSGIPKLFVLDEDDIDHQNRYASTPFSPAMSKSFSDVLSSRSPPSARKRSNTTHHRRTRSGSSSISHHRRTRSNTSETFIPTPIRNWQKGSLLATGNFGKVFLGMNMDNGQLMAVKELEISKRGGGVDSSQLKALEHEITLMSQLNHDHIVRYLGMQRTDDNIYIFLDYVPGGSLEDVLGDFQLPENVIRLYTQQILEGLAYLHENKIIHRDIKAANVLLDDFGCVYLADFGCSKKITTELSKENKSLSGTPNFMAPEVVKKGDYSTKSDVYSLGCTLLQMTTGKPPWHQDLTRFDNVYAFFSWLSESDKWDLANYIPEHLSDNCKDFIRQCLREDVNERPTAMDLMMHPFILEPGHDSESGGEVAQIETEDDLTYGESDEDFDGLQSSYDSESDSDDDSITRDILVQHAVIEQDTPDTEESGEDRLAKPAIRKHRSIAGLSPSSETQNAIQPNLLRRKSMVVASAVEKDKQDPKQNDCTKIAMKFLKNRSKRNSFRFPANKGTNEIQKFLRSNAVSQTARCISSIQKLNAQKEEDKKNTGS